MKARILLVSTAALAAVFFTPAPAWAQDLAAALSNRDFAAVAQMAETGGRDEAALARAVLAASNREDAAAIRGLTAAARSTRLAPALRLSAWQTLSGIYLRQGRFKDASAAMEAGDALGVEQDADTASAFAQARVFATALADETPMQARVAPEGRVALTRDLARLMRANVSINGGAQEAVLDTGAAYSTISHSAAERLGLRILDAEVTVGSATSDAVASRLAIAEHLTIAGGEFRNVVFIVFPDEALTFANGAYKIDAIVGLPVLMQLGRLEFATTEGAEALHHTRQRAHRGGERNLALDGLQPITYVHAPAADATLRMIIDTGARVSSLSRDAAETFPALIEGAQTRATTVGGAGATVTDHDALAIPSLTLMVAGAPVTLQDVRVSDSGARRGAAHGLVGQDILRSGGGYVLDFDAMRFELLPAAS